MTPVRGLVEFAKLNGGVFSLEEAAALGVTRWVLADRVEQGLFARVGYGTYALPGTSTRPDLLLRVAARMLGAVVSHESAGLIHGLGPLTTEMPTVTVSHRGSHRLDGVIVHQSTDMLEAHTQLIDGLRVTTPPRTLIDLGQSLSPPRLAKVLDNALASRIVDLDELSSLHHSLARRGKPGTRRLRRLLEDRQGVEAIADTDLEALLFGLIVEAGLPEPLRQFSAPWLKAIRGRVDFAYPEHRLVIEADSRRWHTLNDAFEVDRRRDNAAVLAGWRVLRFTWRMIVDDPISVVATIRQALGSDST
jgi:hypothetical protein